MADLRKIKHFKEKTQYLINTLYHNAQYTYIHKECRDTIAKDPVDVWKAISTSLTTKNICRSLHNIGLTGVMVHSGQ